jgi:hypothetical protein
MKQLLESRVFLSPSGKAVLFVDAEFLIAEGNYAFQGLFFLAERNGCPQRQHWQRGFSIG